MFLAVQDVRGSGWDPWLELPPTRVITIEQYRSELDARKPSENERDPNDIAWERAFQMLRLISPDRSAFDASAEYSIEAVAAYYSQNERRITVIDRGEGVDRRADVAIFAHELVHAAQDREFGIDWYAAQIKSLDDAIARTAIVEGDAVLYQNVVSFPLYGVSADELNPLEWRQYHNSWLADARGIVAQSTSPYFAIHGLVYPLGSRFFTDAWLSGGSVATRALFDTTPPTTHELMTEAAPAGSRGSVACGLPQLPAGFELVQEPDEFGALMLYAFASGAGAVSDGVAWSLASQWSADLFTLFATRDASELYAAWRILFTNNIGAYDLEQAVNRAALPNAVATASNRELFIAASTSVELLRIPPPCP